MPEASPLRADLDRLLRACVQCGLCLPHCATWLATGNEVHSPRGRLVLLRGLLDGETAAEPAFLAAFDTCIGCRACTTACPSGVPFTLLAHGQHLAWESPGPAGSSAAELALPRPALDLLDRPSWLKAARTAATASRRVLDGVAGSDWRRRAERHGGRTARIARLLGTLPSTCERDADLLEQLRKLESARGDADGAPPAVRPPDRSPDQAPDQALDHPVALAFFAGCANHALLPASSRRLLELLAQLGCRVRAPRGQDCCGALASHAGRSARAESLQSANLNAFADLSSGERILVEAAGCGLEWKTNYRDLADRVVDAVVLLDELPAPALGPVRLRVAVHDPCHARHGQGIFEQPRRLLRRIPGLEVVEAAESEVCCGSGGAWGLRYPELSAELGLRKARRLAETGADLIVTANPGCLGQIADALALEAPGLPVLLLTDLYWAASVRGNANRFSTGA